MRPTQPIVSYESAPNTAVVIVNTFAEEKAVSLDRSARVDLTNLANHIGAFQIVPGHQGAVFVNTVLGKYDVSVTAVGYLTAHLEIDVLSPLTQNIEVVLRRDPDAIVLNEASGLMSSKAKKEANKAVSLLKSGRLADAQRYLQVAYELAPSNADLNFLLGYLYFQKNDYAQAGTYLSTAASLSPHSAQTLILLGRTKLAQQDYPAAQSFLEQAILVDSENWLPHDLLAGSYLHQKEYSKARDEATIAASKAARQGLAASGAADLTLGQALLGVGKLKEGIQALRDCLRESLPSGMTEQVRALIAKAEDASRSSEATPTVAASTPEPLEATPKVEISMQTWRPHDIDDVKPTLDPGVTCPTAQVLAGAGERALELVQDVARFSAREDLFHQQINNAGLASGAETRKYDYVASISSRQGSVLIDEYRTDRVPQGKNPDGIASSGFATLALVFHPELQGDFDFDCEGKGKWRGRPAWLVHFRQRPDRPNRMQSYDLGEQSYRVDLKGRAWLSPDTFQIVHIEADITHPVRDIQLLSEHQVVEYGPVPFAKKSTMLWLPKNVEIYFDFRKRHYYRQYSFDDYMLFDVDVSQNDKLPTAGPAAEPIPSTKQNPN